MQVEFDDDDLREMYEDPKYIGSHSQAIVSKYRERVGFIRGARDERDLYAMRSLRFERLKGKRDHQFSMRLNDQWRLIVEIRGDAPSKIIGIVSVEDYH